MTKKKASSEPSTPSGRAVPTPDYGTSGNQQYTGGPDYFPLSTRNQKLLELLRRIKKKLKQ